MEKLTQQLGAWSRSQRALTRFSIAVLAIAFAAGFLVDAMSNRPEDGEPMKPNVVADSTVVAGDLRALSEEQRERAKAKMREIVDAH